VRVLSIVHQADAGPGVFAEAAAAAGHELEGWSPPDSPPPSLERYDAAMVFGGAMHVDQEERHPWLRPEKELLRGLLESDTPMLGVCLGAQLLAEAAGGSAQRAAEPEIGWFEVEVDHAGREDPLTGPLAPRFEAFEWHSYDFSPPDGAVALAHSALCTQAARLAEAAWAIQFHAEVSPESVEAWIRDYRSDKDALRTDVDPERLRAETQRKIAAWNDVGRELCERFLAEAATRA
jgi:GMP synthase-like glutamine amidotransferase